MPMKLPLDIPKFEGKASEDPQNHIMSFHLWCSSNNIVDDSARLRLFECTLTAIAAKWYIELFHSSYLYLSSLSSMFLQYFQLLVRYDKGVEILLSCCQLHPPTSQITSTSGDVNVSCVRSNWMIGSSLTSF